MRDRQLNSDEINLLRDKLNDLWGVCAGYYWYPLDVHCKRDDVIAFDFEYINNDDKLNQIRALLSGHNVQNVYQLPEYDIATEILDFLDYDLWRSDEPCILSSEYYWFDKRMDWIIYASHEGSITFGGKWLVDGLKNQWIDWKEHLEWDTKNK